MPERGVPTSVLVKCHGHPPARPDRHHDLRRVSSRRPRAEGVDHPADRERNADPLASPRRARTRQPRCSARRGVSASRDPRLRRRRRSRSHLALTQFEHALESSNPQPETAVEAATSDNRMRKSWVALAAIGLVAAATMFAVSLRGGDRPQTPATPDAVTPAQTTPPVTQAASPTAAAPAQLPEPVAVPTAIAPACPAWWRPTTCPSRPLR